MHNGNNRIINEFFLNTHPLEAAFKKAIKDHSRDVAHYLNVICKDKVAALSSKDVTLLKIPLLHYLFKLKKSKKQRSLCNFYMILLKHYLIFLLSCRLTICLILLLISFKSKWFSNINSEIPKLLAF